MAAGGYLSGKPVRALRRISLRTGRQRLIRPPGRSFHGVLSRAFDGVVLFTDARGTVAYSGATGMKLWRRHGAVPENADPADALLYLADGGTLRGRDFRIDIDHAGVTEEALAAALARELGLSAADQVDIHSRQVMRGRHRGSPAAVHRLPPPPEDRKSVV